MVRPQYKITLTYFFISSLWIYFSDRIVQQFNFSSATATLIQTFKGWFFVLVTSLLLFFMIQKAKRDLIKREKEKYKLYETTMRGVHHIVNNFLLKMNFFKEIVSESKAVNQEVIESINKTIFETAEELKKLSNIENPSDEKIRKAVYKNTKAGY